MNKFRGLQNVGVYPDVTYLLKLIQRLGVALYYERLRGSMLGFLDYLDFPLPHETEARKRSSLAM